MADAEATGARANLRRGKVSAKLAELSPVAGTDIGVVYTRGGESWQLPTFD
jgi:hypothetical protein